MPSHGDRRSTPRSAKRGPPLRGWWVRYTARRSGLERSALYFVLLAGKPDSIPGFDPTRVPAIVSGAILTVPYCGLTSADRWLIDWNLDPVVIAVIATAMAMAARSPRLLRTHRWTACGLMVVLWVSPLCAASATLLSVRVVHHMMAMLLLAPAIALGWPKIRAGEPATWAILSGLVLMAWFVPGVYSLAWESSAGYWLLQLAMLGAAWQFWATWLGSAQSRPLITAATPALLAMLMGFVGALLTFAPRPLYTEHILATALFGASPLWDQQLAGLIMWTGGMVPLAVLAIVQLGRRLASAATGDSRC